jgi:hypothetical protein
MSEADIPLRGATLSEFARVAEAERTNASVDPPTMDSATADSLAIADTTKQSPWSADSLWQKAFSFPAMLGVFLVGRVFYEARIFFVDPDLWWHIRIGQDILSTHHWPTVDPYSFTVAGNPWIAYEWLGDVLIGGVARVGGLLGLDILLFAVATAVMLALYGYATLRSGNSKAGFVTAGVLCSLAFASFNLRPQMVGYLYLVLALIALERFRQGKQRAIWFLPPLFLLWINTHGSWVIGLGVVLAFLVTGLFEFSWGSVETERWTRSQRMKLEIVFLLSVAVIPMTPYGIRLAAYPFTVASTLPLNVGNILEWQPMPFNIAGGKLFLAIVLGFFLAQMIAPFKLKLFEAVLLFGGIAMACLHVRFLLLFVPFSAPVLAVMLARWLPPYDRKKDHFLLNAILVAAVVIAIVRYFPTQAGLEKTASRSFPVRAVEYLRQHPVPGPMYNTYGYGGYLVGMLPERKVFIDGRGDLYEDAGVFGEYLEVAGLKAGAFEVLRAHGIQCVLLDRKEPLATALDSIPDWEQRYTDGVSVLFVRRDSNSSGPSGPSRPPVVGRASQGVKE